MASDLSKMREAREAAWGELEDMKGRLQLMLDKGVGPGDDLVVRVILHAVIAEIAYRRAIIELCDA